MIFNLIWLLYIINFDVTEIKVIIQCSDCSRSTQTIMIDQDHSCSGQKLQSKMSLRWCFKQTNKNYLNNIFWSTFWIFHSISAIEACHWRWKHQEKIGQTQCWHGDNNNVYSGDSWWYNYHQWWDWGWYCWQWWTDHHNWMVTSAVTRQNYNPRLKTRYKLTLNSRNILERNYSLPSFCQFFIRNLNPFFNNSYSNFNVFLLHFLKTIICVS